MKFSARSFLLSLFPLAAACAVPLACSASGDKSGGGGLDDGGGTGFDGAGFDIGGGLDGNFDVGGGGLGGDPRTCGEAASAKSYIGCDYWPTVVANNVWNIFDFAVVVANAGEDPATVTVDGPGGTHETATVAPNSLAKIYLPWVDALKGAEADSCGAAVGFTKSVKVTGGAFHLVSSVPVTVYQFNALEYKGEGGKPGKSWSSCPGNSDCPSSGAPNGCFSFSNDASLLLPSTAMTGNYRVTAHHGWTASDPLFGNTPVTGAYFAITATVDNTNVTVKASSKGAILSGTGIAAIAAGGTGTFKLNAGDVIELVGGSKNTDDLGGALVTADNPVQVITGVPCIQTPIGQQACDHIEESVFPAETLGKHYFVTVPTGPKGNVVGHVVRLYGNVDGTALTYAGAKPAGAPATLNAGQVADLAVVSKDFEVTGDHEFAVGSFMLAGALLDPSAGAGKEEGDPSQSNFAAVEQFRKRYIFLSPSDYDLSYVDIVHPDGTTLTLDGADVSSAAKPISGGFSIARVKLGPGKDGGAHVLQASKPVGIQVMGYGLYTSYQYPGGLDLVAIAPPPVK